PDLYAGSTLLACLLEVLAGFRPDATLQLDLADVVEDEEDATRFPTLAPGQVPYSWLEPRVAARATVRGRFCAVTAAESVAALRPQFVALAHRLNLHDFDAAALKDGRPRALTVVLPESWRVRLCGYRDGSSGVLVVDGALHACRAVPSLVVVEAVAPVEDDGAGLVGGGELVPGQDLPLQRGEERFGRGVDAPIGQDFAWWPGFAVAGGRGDRS